MGLHKIKMLCTIKEIASKLKRTPQTERKYLPAIHQKKDR
jgi:predicted transcriptional regulator